MNSSEEPSNPARKDQKSIEGAVHDLADQKARPRSQGADPDAEDPKSVYADACRQIAEAFASEGFRYTISGPHFTRRRGEWKETVSFQSDRNNILGERVGLWTHAVIHNKKLKEWRRTTPSVFRRDDDFVGGGQIGNLQQSKRWIDWDLAKPEQRATTIADVIREVRETVLPFFALVEDPHALARRLVEADVPGVELDAGIELLLCNVGKDEARAYLCAWRSRRADLEVKIRSALQRPATDVGPRLWANTPYADMYVAALHGYGLA